MSSRWPIRGRIGILALWRSERSPAISREEDDIGRIIAALDLSPLEPEGGWFRRTWTSENTMDRSSLPAVYGSDRQAGTAIYYLITADNYSRIHRVPGPEIFHFYLGDPVDFFLFDQSGRINSATLGTDILKGERPQLTVNGGCWQACRLRPGGRFALMGTTMSPGFNDADFELATRKQMTAWLDEQPETVEALLASFTDD